MSYHLLERIGRIPLSRHFSLRQFLYSEIAAAHNIPNVPDDIELAVVTGTRLCQDILEPIVDLFGPIIIRSGYRSTRLNAFGCEHRFAAHPTSETVPTTSGISGITMAIPALLPALSFLKPPSAFVPIRLTSLLAFCTGTCPITE